MANTKAARLPDPLRKNGKDAAFSYAVIAPAMIILLGFTVLPFLISVVKSFSSSETNGFTLVQYQQLLGDAVFRRVLLNNVFFALITVPLTIVISLALAMLILRVTKGSALARTAVLSPTILPVVAAGSVWLYFFQPSFGLFNSILGLFGIEGRNWLGETATAMPALITVTVWQQVGLFVLFYMAAILTIDPQLKEASTIEGAGAWYHFRRVTWPMLMPTTLFVGVMATANSFKHVDLLFVLTQGGPNNSTNLMLYYIWRTAFAYFKSEYAAALTVVLVVLLMIVAIVQIKLMDKRIHYR